MGTVITRVGYCPICAAAHRPWRGGVFLAYGSYRGKYLPRKIIQGDGIAGYTPHIFILKQVTSSNICVVDICCGMYGCGVDYYHSTNLNSMVYGILPDHWHMEFMSINDWNGLVNFKRDPQYHLKSMLL